MEPRVKLATLHKTLVVAFEEGLRLGRVHDVFLDRKAKRISGIACSQGMLGTEEPLYVDRGEILKLGHEVVIVARQDAARTLTGENEHQSLKRLKGRKITTTEGAYLGELSDLSVDRETGTVVELHLNEDRALEVDIADIAIGPHVIVVPNDYTHRVREVPAEKSGVLERARDLASLPESLRHRYAEIKESVNRSKGLEKVVDSLKTGSEKTQSAVKRTSHKLQETIQQIRKAREADGRPAPGAEDPGEYQGPEAEHAGRTFKVPDPAADPEAAHACEGDRAAEIDERCRQK